MNGGGGDSGNIITGVTSAFEHADTDCIICNDCPAEWAMEVAFNDRADVVRRQKVFHCLYAQPDGLGPACNNRGK